MAYMHQPQPRYQKSITTTLPRRSASLNGLPSMSVLSQAAAGLLRTVLNRPADSMAYFAYSSWLVSMRESSLVTSGVLAPAFALLKDSFAAAMVSSARSVCLFTSRINDSYLLVVAK